MFRKTVVAVICVVLTAPGCASASGTRVAQAPAAPAQDRAALADYVQRIPSGSKVRVERSKGGVVRGILMKATADTLVVQKNTRVQEMPMNIALADVTRVTLDTGSSSLGKHIGIGTAIAVGATLLVFGLLCASMNGDC